MITVKLPPGAGTRTASPCWRPSRARPRGDSREMRPERGCASAAVTMTKVSRSPSRWRTTTVEPTCTNSEGTAHIQWPRVVRYRPSSSDHTVVFLASSIHALEPRSRGARCFASTPRRNSDDSLFSRMHCGIEAAREQANGESAWKMAATIGEIRCRRPRRALQLRFSTFGGATLPVSPLPVCSAAHAPGRAARGKLP